MRAWYADAHEVPLPPGHRFPMGKYRALRERLVARGVLGQAELEPGPLIARELLALAHTEAYLEACYAGTWDEAAQRRLGFPWSEALLRRSLSSAGGTLAAARHALAEGFGGNLAGGTHHALPDAGTGYCVFNDLAVTTLALLAEGRVERVLIVDLDVHQGDGTAAILATEPRAFTFSMHGAKNFPFRKQKSSLDLDLPDGCTDDQYLALLDRHLPEVLDRARPDLLLYQAGVDPLKEDALGRLHLTHAGLMERDRQVLSTARRHTLPIAITLGGGYARPIEPTLQAHENTWRVARELFAPASPEPVPRCT